MSDKLAEVPIHQALTRVMLVMGAERPIAVFSIVIPLYLVFILTIRLGFFYAIIVGLGIAFVTINAGVFMARRDPQMSSVLRRGWRYRGYYPASSHPNAVEPVYRSSLRR